MYSRHDLAWLNSAGWAGALAGAAPEHAHALEQWRGHDWPLIVTRRTPEAAPGTLCLGLALPPDTGRKLRIALLVNESAVTRVEHALPLRAAAAVAPARWAGPLAALLADAGPITLRAYGSLALQAVTGLNYLTKTSDIDLLFKPESLQELDAGLHLLQAYAPRLPLDGEIVFPGGAAVAWKEWRDAAGNDARVLVKDANTVRMATTASLRDLLG
ncbi:malonate decarboxylase holo-[acyl-carrier-protein] synthase [Massilia violaceinigra]|uniref:Malonate decarboxylase holo-[acyl-carrier-protein] synthase n=1 Tax=Massilia violaceinigra TaxID=2045208 RepID=A0A2D2DQP8_9BURK|nr:malonate decarboxylase holo-[acyl-carrier-protein] synthase [Massilia violaceinigra]ATQ77297.1 malonate decarboxylase holo-[acyl-carrier-protein] synthase [Massilia violaceinigra]